MAKRISEAVKLTVKAMLLSGKTTPDIIYDAGVSSTTVRKIRRELIQEGKGALWHTDEFLDSRSWA